MQLATSSFSSQHLSFSKNDLSQVATLDVDDLYFLFSFLSFTPVFLFSLKKPVSNKVEIMFQFLKEKGHNIK